MSPGRRSSERPPLVLIANRRSGRGTVARAMPEVLAQLEHRGLEHEVRYTEGRGHATDLARESLARGRRLLVAVGGDGTVHEVVNGMIEKDAAIAPDAAFGVIAAGSGCDFIKTFGLPSEPRFAVGHLEGEESFPIDIGKVTFTEDGREVVRYFPNIAQAGIGADVVERAARLPRWLGPTIYFFAFWLVLRRHRSARVEVDLMDRTYEGPMNNLVVANCQYFGGGMKIAPKAAPTDGVLDVQIEHARKKEAIALMPKVFKGEHVPHPDIKEAKRVAVSITADRALRVEADGEVLRFTPARFELLRHLLNLKV